MQKSHPCSSASLPRLSLFSTRPRSWHGSRPSSTLPCSSRGQGTGADEQAVQGRAGNCRLLSLLGPDLRRYASDRDGALQGGSFLHLDIVELGCLGSTTMLQEHSCPNPCYCRKTRCLANMYAHPETISREQEKVDETDVSKLYTGLSSGPNGQADIVTSRRR